MKIPFVLLLLLSGAARAETPAADPPTLRGLVCINDFVPSIVVDLPYATKENFFRRQFYPDHRAWLLRPVAERLARVQADLAKEGFGLKLWDGYRPLAVQRELWKAKPDPRYVADPADGSRHNRGAAVDVTLVDREGNEVPMPTGYDDFSPRAAAHYLKVTPEVAANRSLLQTVMRKHGFRPLPSEWWHFDAEGWEQHPVLDVPLAELYGASERSDPDSGPGPRLLPPSAEPMSVRPESLEKRVLDLEERVRELEGTVAALRNALAAGDGPDRGIE